jgi:SH3-like domain-containing protein
LREGPENRARRINTLPRKAKVEVLDTMGEWLKVKAQDGSTGWVHEKDLIVPD